MLPSFAIAAACRVRQYNRTRESKPVMYLVINSGRPSKFLPEEKAAGGRSLADLFAAETGFVQFCQRTRLITGR